jgi:hypothetical protein
VSLQILIETREYLACSQLEHKRFSLENFQEFFENLRARTKKAFNFACLENENNKRMRRLICKEVAKFCVNFLEQ